MCRRRTASAYANCIQGRVHVLEKDRKVYANCRPGRATENGEQYSFNANGCEINCNSCFELNYKRTINK